MKLFAKKKPDAPKIHTYGRNYQLLLIPDGQSEPRHFQFSARRIKLLRIAAIILGVHLLLGFFAYIQLARLASRNRGLERVNIQLVENSKKVYELAAIFQKLEASDAKLRSALGLSSDSQSGTLDSEALLGVPESSAREVPRPQIGQQPAVKPVQVNLGEKLDFLQQSREIGIHDYLRSLPTYLPVAGVLTRSYSDRGAPHQGIDIAAPRGSAISAAGDGVVVFSGWTQDLGNMVILYHGDGFFTYYGHTQRNLVQRASLVRKGDHIALVGSSGESTAPHLHFELWKDGISLNPADYILAFARM